MLNAHERRGLEALLAHAVNPDEAMNIDQLEGYLFGVVMTPDVTQPSEWFVDIFGDGLASFEDTEEANERMAALLKVYNRLNTLRLRGDLNFPFDLADLDETMLDRLRDWAVGLDRALELRAYIWVPEEMLEQEEVSEEVEEVMTCLMVVLGVAHPEQIPEIFEGTDEGGEDERLVWARLVGSLPQAVHSLLARARELEAVRLGEAPPGLVRGPKIGRNQPCPCGSGRKYKTCCGLN